MVEKSCFERFYSAAATGACTGTFFGACAAAWYPDPITAEKGRFVGVTDHTHTNFRALLRTLARPALFFTLTGSAFAIAECTAESVRNKHDSINSAIGGLFAGALIGAYTKRVDVMTSAALGTALLMFGVDYSAPLPIWDRTELDKRMYDTLPEKHEESETVKNFKEKYPKFKDL